MTAPHTQWDDIQLALQLLAIDPDGLKGIWLRSRSGIPRDRFIAALGTSFPDRRTTRLHNSMTDDQLYGGVDLAATLDTGRTVESVGALQSENALFLLTMAERADPSLAAKLALALDMSDNILIALDEGLEHELIHEALSQRLAFHIDFSTLTHRDSPEFECDTDVVERARIAIGKVETPASFITDLTTLALKFGITDLRAPSFALRATRALAALSGRTVPDQSDLLRSAALIYGPRATAIPESAEDQELPEPTDSECGTPSADPKPSEDLLLEAVSAALPKDLLESLKSRSKDRASKASSGSGDRVKGNRRGRPKPPRRGRLGTASRLDLVATLRAAAPWQAMRRNAQIESHQKILIRSADIRLKQFEDRSDRLLIFVVDASGSAALARLAEAKGAVELLLAEAYARRDHVALIAFRGHSADLLLPPTRSLVQTKRRLAGLPGGGGTPLASGLEAAMELAYLNRSKGLTPTIALLTDGRANIGLDGTPSRVDATRDAQAVAKRIRAAQTPAIVIDTANRPQQTLKDLAQDLDAPYLPLPRADAHKVSQAIEAVLE